MTLSIKMEDTKDNKKIIKILSELPGIDNNYKEISIELTPDGTPLAVAFFDIDKTLAELKNIHGKAIKTLFKTLFDKDFEGIEEVYFRGFRLGNSFREFDRMNGIYNFGYKEWIDENVYIKERLDYKKKEIDSEGNETHDIAKMYLDKYVEIASSIADDIYKNNKEEFELSKIKPVFALAKFYKSMGVPMFGMTANGKKFVDTISKYLGLSDLFIDIATDEDMVGGGKEIIIPKLIKKLENKGIKVSKEKLVIVGDSLFGDIGSGYRYRDGEKEIFIKGILVLKDVMELKKIQNQIALNPDLSKIIKNTDTEAFITDNVKMDIYGAPVIMGDKRNFLVKL
jgi:phosphoglycolate phosphatase-like HAD superfamily hydrolase